MSGGISANRGFIYQAAVTLDRLLSHFDGSKSEAYARPEGDDDLDLTWTSDGLEHRRYEQIKKPRENLATDQTFRQWTLQDAIEKLFPDALKHLTGNTYEQTWILGDEASTELAELVDAGALARRSAALPYWRVVHALACKALSGERAAKALSLARASRWRPTTSEINQGFPSVVRRFQTNLADSGGPALADAYLAAATKLDTVLPDVLARVRIESLYGTEAAVAQRVKERLAAEFALPPTVVDATLYRNLRGFIADIGIQPGRRFDRAELEFELRCAWPQMLQIKKPPLLDEGYVERPELTDVLTDAGASRATEIIGASGTGKTMLASAAIGRSHRTAPDRIALYVEIRPDSSLRDALVGIAYHLRRFRVDEPFRLAIEGDDADPDAITKIARSLATSRRDMLFVLDLVQGHCNGAFARDLATFVRANTFGGCRIVVLGQESPFRFLTGIERRQISAMRKDIPGLRFEEFEQLVAITHPDAETHRLRAVFDKVTVGRATGLFAGLAQSLARAASLEAMEDIAAHPGEDIVFYAEQQRFDRLSAAARPAAERLICFALPFTREDAEDVFGEDNIALAIREMSTLGLLRANDELTFEMHEMIRADLERTLAKSVRKRTHTALADWYERQAMLAAQILHLEAAGQADQADAIARAAFLRGESWGALAAFVTRRRLVTAADVITVFASAKQIEEGDLLLSLLRALGDTPAHESLLRLPAEQTDRYIADFRWSSAITDAVLALLPDRVDDLIALVVEAPAQAGQRKESALTAIRLGLRRANAGITATTIALFSRALLEEKRLLLPLMLSESRRDALRPAFEFISAAPLLENRRREPSRLVLVADRQEDVVEILAALPVAQLSLMLAIGSPLLGNLGPLIWRERAAMRRHCLAVANAPEVDDRVVEAALRILIFLKEPSVATLCEAVAVRGGRLGTFASMVRALVPHLIDVARQEVRLFDRAFGLSERLVSLSLLVAAKVDLDSLYQRFNAAEGDGAMPPWDFFFLQASNQVAFVQAIPLLEQHLRSEASNGAGAFVSTVMRLGRFPEATSMLEGALSHTNPRIRLVAAMTLGERRSTSALLPLVERFRAEQEPELLAGLAAAIVASGPTDSNCLGQDLPVPPEIRLWQCVLAMRLRDESAADVLVATATDRALHWQVRRAAIEAAGRLPYALALHRIAPNVLQEQTPLLVDNYELSCHALLSHMLQAEGLVTRGIFVRGRATFIEFFADVLAPNDWQPPEGRPDGATLAAWLYDRFEHHNWQENDAAVADLQNELHVPLLQSAVLRALRRAGRGDLIEAHIVAAVPVWLVIKCLIECHRTAPGNPDLLDRLRNQIAASRHAGAGVLERVLYNIAGSRQRVAPSEPAAPQAPTPPSLARSLSYVEAVRRLSEGLDGAAEAAGAPWVLEDLTREQFEHLVALAAPSNDKHRTKETYVPSLTFSASGYLVAQRRISFEAASDTAAAALRPAIAAANIFAITIPWHEDALEGILAPPYIAKLLACLNARDDGERFYDELALHPLALLPHLCKAAVPGFRRHLDDRMIPFLVSYASAGTDEMFEAMCALASTIDDPAIDGVLASLLKRWAGSIDPHALDPHQSENFVLWRGFGLLANHPRFQHIDDWQSSLAGTLGAHLPFVHKQSIVRILERDPRSYMLVEAALFKEEDWTHFLAGEIDRLDLAAERLFAATRN